MTLAFEPHAAYSALTQHIASIHHLEHLRAMAGWDQATMMPSGGNESRSHALAELGVLIHAQRTDVRLPQWIAAAEQAELSAAERANVGEIKRQWHDASLLPSDLVQALSLAGSRCEHAWRQQRVGNDWAGFAKNFTEVVTLSRHVANLRADALQLRPYDALLARYEPGMTCRELDGIFGDLATWLPTMIRTVQAKQAGHTPLTPQGPFAVAQQEALGRQLMTELGFDFNHGRLDSSAHPFCGGVADDVRITTRYNPDECLTSLMGIIHETGHARYEQGLPVAWRTQPLGQARSMAMHESQSLFFEMQLARDPAFLQQLSPKLSAQFGDQPAFSAANLTQLAQRVQPGFIRVDADELTYPAHVILRYEIERDLMEERIEVADIPALWDEKMRHWLGLSTAGNFSQGCLQDIHWTDGSFGYFPSYTLGAMVAAQLRYAMERELGALSPQLASGDYAAIFAWLNTHIWQHGSRFSTRELITQASGEALNPAWFKRHLSERYLS
ncbi:MAG: carboxypeptidase M32 [Aeromonas sp.]